MGFTTKVRVCREDNGRDEVTINLTFLDEDEKPIFIERMSIPLARSLRTCLDHVIARRRPEKIASEGDDRSRRGVTYYERPAGAPSDNLPRTKKK